MKFNSWALSLSAPVIRWLHQIIPTGESREKTIIAVLLAAAANYANAGTVLVVLSDQAQLDLKDGKVMQTGFFLNELMQPVQTFIAAGQTVVFATLAARRQRRTRNPMM